MFRTHLTTSLAFALVTSLGVVSTAHAQTDYDFDETCAPVTEVDSKINAPKVLMILDRSGSMNNGLNGVTKLSVAKLAINEVAASSTRSGPCSAADDSGCDEIELGLGWFSTNSDVPIAPDEDTQGAIASNLAAWGTNGCTETGKAAKELHDSSELAEGDSTGVGVIITDGAPYICGDSNIKTIEDSVYYLCQMRNRQSGAVPTYMIGLGFGTDSRMNGFMAAAGGTGRCCQGSGCTYEESTLVDPCDLYDPAAGIGAVDVSPMVTGNKLRDGYECDGSIEATSAQAFKDALVAIAGEASCTFPLAIPDEYPAGEGADEDPYATAIEFDHDTLGDDLEIPPYLPGDPNLFYDYLVNQRGVSPAVADPFKGEGWIFADGTRRNIRLTDKLCEEVKQNNVSTTRTQVACLCENTDKACQTPCNDPANPDAACKTCEEGDFELPCLGLQGTDQVQVGRCNRGIVECVVGVEYCVSQFTKQPEICNGVDDNCNGEVDDMSSANPASGSDPIDPVVYEALSTEEQSLFCAFQDSCGCKDGTADDLGPAPGSFDDEFELLRDSYSGNCTCGQGLAPETASASPTDEPEPYEDDGAACSSTRNTGAAGSASLLALLGLSIVGARRRRRD